MRYLFLLFISLSLYAEHKSAITSIEENSTKVLPEETSQEDVIVVKDESGLSDDAIRKKAKVSDKKKHARVKIEDVVEHTDAEGNVDLSKMQERWEDLSPTPLKYDWVKTKSGEWFKGEIKALFDKKLEFDSVEIGLYTFDFDDVVEIRSYHLINVNIENLASFPGVMRMKDGKITIIQGDNSYEFAKKDIISFAPEGEHERNNWSGKLTFSFDIRKGNINQFDYSAKVNIKRRTAKSRLSLDYLGRNSSQNNKKTANDHRLNEKYDVYLSKKYFWTPLFSEYYTDTYKNINNQVTAGIGLGYTPFDRTGFEWNFSGGPAFVFTEYVTVPNEDKNKIYSPALEFSTHLDNDLTKITELTLDYKMIFTKKNAGHFKHHLSVTLENDLLSWLDFDVSGIWDYTRNPEESASGIAPERNDYQLLVGFGVEF